MDIFKLVFNHDQEVRNLSGKAGELSIDDFLKPIHTFSSFRLSGTNLDTGKAGLSELERGPEIIETSKRVLEAQGCELIESDVSLAEIGGMLDSGKALYRIVNHGDGVDIEAFSRSNFYISLFDHFKTFLSPSFRFFSINGKRIANEQLFYFETYRLDRPPHGFEEVFPNTVL